MFVNICKYIFLDYDKNILVLIIGKVEILLCKLYVICWFMLNIVMFFMDKINMIKCVFIYLNILVFVF